MKIIKYAAIDIGTNAIRMLIANVIFKDNKSYIFKNSLIRLPIRLGEDSFTKGHISESKILNFSIKTAAWSVSNLPFKPNLILSYLSLPPPCTLIDLIFSASSLLLVKIAPPSP